MRLTRSQTIAAALAAVALATGLASGQGLNGGVANRMIGTFQSLNESGPGWFYYGVNAADRGLGYQGSYMTLGGFVPYAEDDLGGFWAADVRSHLSVHGGFFSNVGAVRKQMLGGTLLGVGVYWDYDGDMNQYPTGGLIGTQEFGQFGHTYNQVGVSGEWLTDYGNLRSNGYIPVDTTAYTVGQPGSPFVGNYVLCQNGLDAALGGVDLEVGAYVPGLADWAGMISVGGYAFGNARYTWTRGSAVGDPMVPWFGGVYTRLDMTFMRNWDFSLQYNNDSFFDSTGFARLTYRMGGSRRRNVPDQMEQPMMRNEHIVRAHETPVVAYNPETSAPWRVFHVDNTAPLIGANGTVEKPFQTLASASGAVVTPHDIVYVHRGNSLAEPYEANWQFQADDQILVGEGSTLEINTSNCGWTRFFTTGTSGISPQGLYPVLTSTSGTAIALRDGTVVDHFRIQDATVGIVAGADVSRRADVNDVEMQGTNAPGQVGVAVLGAPSGVVNFYNMSIADMGNGLLFDGNGADIVFQGEVRTTGAGSTQPILLVQDNTGNAIDVNVTTDSLRTPLARNGRFFQSYGLFDVNSGAAAAIDVSLNTGASINVGQIEITTPTQRGVAVQNNTSTDIAFLDMVVEDAGTQAFLTQGNSGDSSVSITGRSSLSSSSSTLPAFASNDAAELLIDLESLSSQTAANPPGAIQLLGTSTGQFTISESFSVAGNPGTVAGNVDNGTGVVVTVP